MKNIILEKQNNTLTITINRPDKLNALNIDLIDELNDIFSNYRKTISNKNC